MQQSERALHIWSGFAVYSDNIPARKAGIYGLLCLPNGKWYIGTSKNIAVRLRAHSRGSHSGKLKRAIKKHGVAAFVAIPLFYTAEADGEFLGVVEAQLIAEYDSRANGYNIQSASRGAGPYGPEFAATIRRIMGTPESRKRKSELGKARWADPGYRASVTKQRRQALSTPEAKAKQAANLHRDNSEIEAKRIAAVRATFEDPEIQARRAAANRRIAADPEWRAKNSAAQKAALAVPGVLQARVEAQRRARDARRGQLCLL